LRYTQHMELIEQSYLSHHSWIVISL